MHVVHLAEALDPTRFRTRLITGRITEDEGDMTYYARERGVEVTEITGMSRLLSPLGDLRSFLTLLRRFSSRTAHDRTHPHRQGGYRGAFGRGCGPRPRDRSHVPRARSRGSLLLPAQDTVLPGGRAATG